MVHSDIRKDPLKKELWVRRWLVFVTLFVAGLAMAIDVIMLLNSYLQGELSIRFGLKALTVFAVLGGVFWYFLEELRGRWERNPKLSTALGGVATFLVVISIAASFFIIGSPETARLMKIDDQKIADLQTVQWQLVSFWQSKETLPAELTELNDPLSGFSLPKDPETGMDYVYERTSNSSFKLCAMFNRPSRELIQTASSPMRPLPAIDPSNENWRHEAGEACFDRTIDPERYPPYTKGS